MQERLVCWLVDYSSGTQIISDDKSTDWPRLFNLHSSPHYRFLFPIMDLDEADRIQPTIIENGFMSPLLSVSRRYDADKLLLGRLQKLNGIQTTLSWQLYDAKTEGGALIRGEVAGAPEQLVVQLLSALESFRQEQHSVTVTNRMYPLKQMFAGMPHSISNNHAFQY